MVIVTHEVPFAQQISDQVAFVDAGRIVEQGPPEQVIGDPQEQRTRAFLSALDDRLTCPSVPTVVIGGGIIGLACAYELATAGHDVQVVDRASVGAAPRAGMQAGCR